MTAYRHSTILILVLVAGCERSKESPPADSAQVKSEATVSPQRAPAPIPEDIADTVDQAAPEQPGEDSADPENINPMVPAESAEDDSSDSETVEPLAETGENQQADAADYRLWLPTSAGPVLVDLDLFVDNQPLRQAFDQKLDLVLSESIGDDQQDPASRLSWDSLFERVAADPATFGQTSARVSGQEKGLIKRYDRNQNMMVDDDELVRFLYRDSNFASEFRLFGTDAFRWSNRSGSRLFSAIDRNGDRKLDPVEIELASESLLRNVDQNADECISLVESTIQLPSNDDAWQRSRSTRHGNVAMDFSGFVNWSNLSYAMGGMLKSNQVPVDSNPVAQLDKNQDQWISPDEAESVRDVPASIHVTARFNSNDSSTTGVQASVQDSFDLFGSVQQLGPAGTWVSTSRLQIGFLVVDAPTSQNRIPREVFDQLDVNNDGSIDESEIPDGAQSQLPLQSLDKNGDGKLTFMEINQAIKQSESIWSYQIRGRGAEHPDGVFAWLDRNHDQFLSSREVHAATKQLESLLQEKDAIRSTDIPDTFIVQLVRGEPEQDTTRLQLTRRMVGAEDQRPQWAIRMDGNLDGEISETEFIGPIDAFERLDLNGDHFLTSDEIKATL